MPLTTAVSGLLAYQRAIATVSHNIANVGTEGYSRQRVDLMSRTPQLLGNSYVGRGVQTSAVDRIYDKFLVNQVDTRTSSYGELKAYSSMASQLDTLLGDTDIALGSSLQQFFSAVQDVSTNPTSTPARQVMILKGESLTDRLRSLDRHLEDMRSSVNAQLDVMVGQVNSLAESISEINRDIVASGGGSANDLLDQRDRLVNDLSKLVNVTSVAINDGSINVYVGTGQSLVLGAATNKLSLSNNEFDVTQKEVALQVGTSTVAISKQVTGGEMGGLLRVRQDVIIPSQNALGRIAISLANTFNTQHRLGADFNGNAGGDFFTAVDTASPRVLPSVGNAASSGTVSVSIADVNALQVSDYRLNYNGSDFLLVRQSDNTVVDSGFAVSDLPRTVASEGISISLAGTVVAGDSFLILPTRFAASASGVDITNPAAIAAAASGTAVGNNSNALALVALQTQKSLAGSTATYQGAFGEIIADVGIKTNQALVNGKAQKALLEQAQASRSAVSGVNLDEEAANLLKFQQAYQASARVVTIVDSLFQTLIDAVR
ncbi:MAG: flagellar hook-associated protein FlgK [Gammaproteobacteria bacterium]|nr:flagellar hook-associated protein FlgK [Gammaproteobacteria bacterium]